MLSLVQAATAILCTYVRRYEPVFLMQQMPTGKKERGGGKRSVCSLLLRGHLERRPALLSGQCKLQAGVLVPGTRAKWPKRFIRVAPGEKSGKGGGISKSLVCLSCPSGTFASSSSFLLVTRCAKSLSSQSAKCKECE